MNIKNMIAGIIAGAILSSCTKPQTLREITGTVVGNPILYRENNQYSNLDIVHFPLRLNDGTLREEEYVDIVRGKESPTSTRLQYLTNSINKGSTVIVLNNPPRTSIFMHRVSGGVKKGDYRLYDSIYPKIVETKR